MSVSSASQPAARTYFDDLASAMRFYRVPVEAQATVRSTLQGIVHDGFYVPPSRPYIAVTRQGRVVARVHMGHIGVVGAARVELPGYRARSRGARRAHPHAPRQMCPVCRLELPRTGTCDRVH
ncbi:MAG TPA: hypothetical protein VEQ66_04555 [Propionibacteriaceae bacterium]|nr:hypothetical protein [Propionibacteriaceae bacterium]